METKSVESVVADVTDRTVTGFASVFGVLDIVNDITHPGSFSKTLQERGGRKARYLWMHDQSQVPPAVIRELREVGKNELPAELVVKYPEATGALLVKREYLETPRGEELLQAIKAHAIDELSFGYDAVKFDYSEHKSGDRRINARNLREVALWDISDVTFGANPATQNVKSAIPYRDTGKADKGKPWSKPGLGDFSDKGWGELDDSERKRIAAHYAWAADYPPDAFGDMKLPHHEASQSGVGPAVWNGVKSAMGVLMGAMGGAKIDDRKAVYEHLSKHYHAFGEEPPTLKTILLVHDLQTALASVPIDDFAWALAEIKSGDFADNETTKSALMGVLDKLAQKAEPSHEPSRGEDAAALTRRVNLIQRATTEALLATHV